MIGLCDILLELFQQLQLPLGLVPGLAPIGLPPGSPFPAPGAPPIILGPLAALGAGVRLALEVHAGVDAPFAYAVVHHRFFLLSVFCSTPKSNIPLDATSNKLSSILI